MNTAIILNPNDFDRLIKEVKQHLSQEVENIKTAIIEKPMCVKEAAEYLGVNASTLHRRLKNGTIPASLKHELDGSTYFFKSELYQYLKTK